MSIRTLLIILIILMLIPLIMERIEVSVGDFFSNPKDAFLTFFKNVWDFYTSTLSDWIGNIIEEKIKGTKIEIELKKDE